MTAHAAIERVGFARRVHHTRHIVGVDHPACMSRIVVGACDITDNVRITRREVIALTIAGRLFTASITAATHRET